MSQCQQCPLSGGKQVGSRGPVDALFVVVGEAPGSTELARGLPFVGPAGHLLDGVLKRAGLPTTGQGIFVTNALRCCPPLGGSPTRAALVACRPRLLAEIQAAPRTVIVALGGSALQSLLGRFDLKITKERGRVFETEFGRVVATIHPAAVLRSTQEYRYLAEDVAYAAALYKGTCGVRSSGSPQIVVCDTPKKALQAAAALGKLKYLGADLETGRGDPTSKERTEYNPRKGKVLSLGISWAKNKVFIFPSPMIAYLRPLFHNSHIRWVWHNGKFDTAFLKRQLHLPARVDEDTLLLHYCLNEQRGTHDLKQLATDYLGAPDYEAQMKKYLPTTSAPFDLLPPQVLYKYNAMDADCTLQLFLVLRQQVAANPQLEGLYQLLLRASSFLQQVESRGIYVHSPALDELEQELREAQAAQVVELVTCAEPYWDPALYAAQTKARKQPIAFNPASVPQLTWLIYRRMGLHPRTRGVPCNTCEGTLQVLPQTPFVRALLNYRKTAKALSTYVEGIRERLEAESRVHTTYLLHGTTTGRLASREPNLMNIPREGPVKGIFQAPPGRLLAEFDYKQLELMVLAHLSKDQELLRIFCEGRSLHREVATTMYGPDYTQSQYIRAKAVNFGIAYGRQAYSLAQEFGIPTTEAQAIINAWNTRFSAAYRYIEACRQHPLQGRILVSSFGRHRRPGLVTQQNANSLQNEFANHPIQSTASDLMLQSAMVLDPLLSRLGAFVVNLVHDSILVETPESAAVVERVVDCALRVLAQTPRELLRSDVPFAAEAKVGKVWGKMEEWQSEIQDSRVVEETIQG